jgi:hypothetical protein
MSLRKGVLRCGGSRKKVFFGGRQTRASSDCFHFAAPLGVKCALTRFSLRLTATANSQQPSKKPLRQKTQERINKYFLSFGSLSHTSLTPGGPSATLWLLQKTLFAFGRIAQSEKY